MHITPFNALLAAFILFAWSRAFLRWRKCHARVREFLLWSFVWCAALVFLFLPGSTSSLAALLGVKHYADAIFAFGIGLLFYVNYRTYARLDEMERQITELARLMALREEAGWNPPDA